MAGSQVYVLTSRGGEKKMKQKTLQYVALMIAVIALLMQSSK